MGMVGLAYADGGDDDLAEVGKHDDVGVDEGGAVNRLLRGGGKGLGVFFDDDEQHGEEEGWVYAPEVDCEWEWE